MEFVEFKKISVEEMDALRQENIKLKWRVEAKETTGKGKEKQTLDNTNSVQKSSPRINCIRGTEEESKYNPTLKTYISLEIGVSRQHPFIDDITNNPPPPLPK
ncbi:hypothetical protein LR48_Vigan09g067100 [Vigna angularis]|uniref:Uncharacterized protein n=1 Tax=Phaseolus angularis TaxID=3914 RepID=A0A0L9VAS8_PHAAN|nr:hypothetical protein LR48_Vigan09g067100 [Vigna angularis]